MASRRRQRVLPELPGGLKQALLRRAHGVCELCGSSLTLSYHHIIPRSEGGLDTFENFILLCYLCHDEIEETNCRTREAILAHPISHEVIPDLKDLEKQARRKAALHPTGSYSKQEDKNLFQWCLTWDRWIDRTVIVRDLVVEGEAQRPEKPWHSAVYAGAKE